MIGRRTWWEVFHVVLGLAAAAVMAYFAARAYPLARTDIWVVAIVAMLATLLMGVTPVRRAMAEDKGERGAGAGE